MYHGNEKCLSQCKHGFLSSSCSDVCVFFDDNSQPDELYGEDPTGPAPNEFDLGSVDVPDTNIPLTDTELGAISHIQPLSVSDNYGVDLYLETRQLILALMQAHQN